MVNILDFFFQVFDFRRLFRTIPLAILLIYKQKYWMNLTFFLPIYGLPSTKDDAHLSAPLLLLLLLLLLLIMMIKETRIQHL